MKTLSILIVLINLVSCSGETDFLLSSPNGNVQLNLSNKSNYSNFTLMYAKDTLLKSSNIGLQINDISFVENIRISEFQKKEFNETWKTVNGKHTTVNNHYNEYKLHVAKTTQSELHYEIVFRIYDKGFAYRYIFPSESIQNNIKIQKELTNLNFNSDYTYWAYNGEKHNVGPIIRSEKKIEEVRIPIVMKFRKNSYMAIHEAEIIEFAPFTLNASTENKSLSFNTSYTKRNKAFKTSWRTFMLGKKIGDLVESDLIVNLNEPCKIEDTSWIKPGKSLWDWRVWGYKAPDGFEYGLDTKSHKRFIDFAAKNNIQHLLIDANWYGDEFSEGSDPATTRKDINIEECMRYAHANNVGVILYLNDIGAKKFGLEKVLKQFSKWGASGVKYGFMKGNWEQKVKNTRKVVELCAKYKLMVNFHDNPVPPSGDRRTWPNLVTKEYGHAQADGTFSHYPETSVNQVLVNQIAGPLDLTNGWFNLNTAQNGRPRVFEEIPGTVVAEVAKLITTYSGWSILSDSPEAYLKKEDLFECVKNMPTQFDDFKILDAKFDEFVSVARRAGEDWFIGSLTNRESRTITLDLKFLKKNVDYEAIIYKDADNSHFINNKESYKIHKQLVTSKSKLSIKMKEGGGNAVHIKKIENANN